MVVYYQCKKLLHIHLDIVNYQIIRVLKFITELAKCMVVISKQYKYNLYRVNIIYTVSVQYPFSLICAISIFSNINNIL